jgi:hypothetical protein
MRRLLLSLLALSMSALSVLPANADPITVTGQATVVAAPPSVVLVPTGTSAWVFFQGRTVLDSPGAVDISTPGSYPTLASLTPGTLPVGTALDVYYFHSFGNRSGTAFRGSITFPRPILGLEVLGPSLVATNFGSTTFPTGLHHGIEFEPQLDSLIISPDRRTLSFANMTFNRPDDLRVGIAATPEPGCLLLVGSGLALAFRKRRR